MLRVLLNTLRAGRFLFERGIMTLKGDIADLAQVGRGTQGKLIFRFVQYTELMARSQYSDKNRTRYIWISCRVINTSP